MSNLDYFMSGFTRSLERRSKQQTKQHSQTAKKVDGDAINTITSAINNNTTEFSDEQYQNSIVTKMVALIHKRKVK